MMKKLALVFVIVGLVLAVDFAMAQESTAAAGAFADELQSGPALKGIRPELSEALLSLAALADAYAGRTLADLKAMPGAETGEDRGLFHVTLPESEGVTKEFWYNRKEELLSSVKVTRSDGSAVAVDLTKYTLPADEREIRSWPDLVSLEELADGRWLRATVGGADGSEKVYFYNRRVPELSWTSHRYADGSGGAAARCSGRTSELRLSGGFVIQPGGKRRWVVHYDRGASRLPAWAARYDAGTGEGSVTLWDAKGAVVAECAVNNQPIPEFMIQDAASKLTGEQLDALAMPARERLVVHPAFKRAERGLQRSMLSIASLADRHGRALPGDLPYLFPGGDLHVTHIEGGDGPEFRVMGQEDAPDRFYAFGKESGAWKKIEQDSFAVYFDPQEPGDLMGGRAEDSEKGQVWLVSFYPGTCAPRMALATAGEPATGPVAQGKVYAWSPEGERWMEKEVETATPVATVVGEIGATLTGEQKEAMNWRGPAEARYLLGEF